jgi:hemin uptake protein HemP
MQNPPTGQSADHSQTSGQIGTQPGNPHGRTVPSTDLLRGDRSVEISHNGSVYRLQATKLGKLILTK